MTIEQLRTFQAVARCRSFSDAARALHVTQPSVSARIKGLEGAVGARLFRRRGTGVELTQEGTRYLQFVDRALHLLDEGQGSISGGAGTGCLRVGAPSSLVEFLLPKAVITFSTRWPHLRLKVVTGTTEALVESFRASDVDLIFVRYRPTTVASRVLAEFREPVLAVAPPDHPTACGASPYPYPCVLLDQRRGYWSVQAKFPRNPLQLAEVTGFEVDNVTTAKSLVLEGRAIGLLPASTVVCELQSGALVRLRLPGPGMHRTVVAVADPNLERTRPAQAFVEAVGDAIASIAGTVVRDQAALLAAEVAGPARDERRRATFHSGAGPYHGLAP